MKLPLFALAALGVAVAVGAVAGWVLAREACLNRAAGADDPTPADIGAAEARDHMRWCDPDGAW